MIEKTMEVDRMEDVISVFGSFDQNLRMIETEYNVRVTDRDEQIHITGEAENVLYAEKAIAGLLSLAAKGEEIGEQNVRYIFRLVREGREQKIQELAGDVVCITAKGKPIKAKTLGQRAYLDAIEQNTITLGVGPAGTGKTYLAVAAAVAAFRERKVNRIILTRPAVEAGERLGFLPGDLQSKVCARCTTRSLRCSARTPMPSISSAATSRSRRWRICAGARSTTASSSSTRRKTPPASR